MQKMKSKKGFTLIEMLIVVAIIGILVAVSIPMVNSSLEKARVATDLANERAAKAAALVIFLGGDLKDTTGNAAGEEDGVTATTITDNTKPLSYDAAGGKLAKNGEKFDYGKCSEHKGGYITVWVNEETDEVTINWAGDKVEKTDSHLKAEAAGG